MTQEILHQQSLIELKHIKQYLNDEVGLQSELLEKSEAYLVNILIVMLGEDSQKRQRSSNLIFLPVKDDDFSNISLLQYYSQLPFEVISEFRDTTIKFINHLNEKTSIGNFGVTVDGNIYLRYIYSIPKNEIIRKETFVETFQLLMFMQEIFCNLIEEVATGVKSYDDAVIELEE